MARQHMTTSLGTDAACGSVKTSSARSRRVILLILGIIVLSTADLLVTVAFAKGLVVIGLLVMMRAGLVSFGQGLYFGLGAYAAGLAANFLG